MLPDWNLNLFASYSLYCGIVKSAVDEELSMMFSSSRQRVLNGKPTAGTCPIEEMMLRTQYRPFFKCTTDANLVGLGHAVRFLHQAHVCEEW